VLDPLSFLPAAACDGRCDGRGQLDRDRRRFAGGIEEADCVGGIVSFRNLSQPLDRSGPRRFFEVNRSSANTRQSFRWTSYPAKYALPDRNSTRYGSTVRLVFAPLPGSYSKVTNAGRGFACQASFKRS
jgi:hypothetical protein